SLHELLLLGGGEPCEPERMTLHFHLARTPQLDLIVRLDRDDGQECNGDQQKEAQQQGHCSGPQRRPSKRSFAPAANCRLTLPSPGGLVRDRKTWDAVGNFGSLGWGDSVGGAKIGELRAYRSCAERGTSPASLPKERAWARFDGLQI